MGAIRAAVIAAAMAGAALAVRPAAGLTPEPELSEVTAESFGEAHARNGYATEAALKGRTFKFTGVPMAVTAWPDGLPRVTYAVPHGTGRVQAQLVREAIPAAAGIVPGKPLALVCTGAEDGMLFPFVTGCRPIVPPPVPKP